MLGRLADAIGDEHADPLRHEVATVAVKHLAGVISTWERQLPAGLNTSIYRYLLRLDPARRERHAVKVVEWQAVSLEADRTKRLPALIQQGQFVMLFLYYYDVLGSLGLQVDAPVLPPMAERDEQRMIQGWRSRPDDVPDPFTASDGTQCLSSEFLRFGWYLTHGDLKDDPVFDRTRELMNDIAGHNMRRFYRQMLASEHLPDPIRVVLRRHKDSYARYVLPD